MESFGIFSDGEVAIDFPWLLDLQSQLFQLCNSTSFNLLYSSQGYPVAHPQYHGIPNHLFSLSLFSNGWYGQWSCNPPDLFAPISSSPKQEDAKMDKDKDEEKDVNLSSRAVIALYNNDFPRKTEYVTRLWCQMSHNLVVPKSLVDIIAKVRPMVLSALIRHLPKETQSCFFSDKDKSLTEVATMKEVFMIGNNVLRWCVDRLRDAKKNGELIRKLKHCDVQIKHQKKVVDHLLAQSIGVIDRKVPKASESKEQPPIVKDGDVNANNNTNEKQAEVDAEAKVEVDAEAKEKENIKENNEENLQTHSDVKKLEDLLKERKHLIHTASKEEIVFAYKYLQDKGKKEILDLLSDGVSFEWMNYHTISAVQVALMRSYLSSRAQHMFDAFESTDEQLYELTIRPLQHRIEILLQLNTNPQITMDVIQEFLCSELAFSFGPNPCPAITQIIQSRHVVKQHKIEAVKKMLETIELAEQCYSKCALCLAVHIPSPWVWCYFDGLAGLNMSEETHDLREMMKIWVHKLTQIGNKVAQSLASVQYSPVVSSSNSSGGGAGRGRKRSGSRLQTLDDGSIQLFRVILRSLSSCQLTASDMSILMESNLLMVLFQWEHILCHCEWIRIESLWHDMMKLIESCTEGWFQYAQFSSISSSSSSSVQSHQHQVETSQIANILVAQILKRLDFEIRHCFDKTGKKSEKSVECMCRYLKLIHRLQAFTSIANTLRSPANLSCFTSVLLPIVVHCHLFGPHQLSVLSLATRSLCHLLPQFDVAQFNTIFEHNKDKWSQIYTAVPFDDATSFIKFLLLHIGEACVVDVPTSQSTPDANPNSNQLPPDLKLAPHTISGTSQPDVDTKQGTYSVVIKLPVEGTSSMVDGMVAHLLDNIFYRKMQEFVRMQQPESGALLGQLDGTSHPATAMPAAAAASASSSSTVDSSILKSSRHPQFTRKNAFERLLEQTTNVSVDIGRSGENLFGEEMNEDEDDNDDDDDRRRRRRRRGGGRGRRR
ncbi:hypothetical protein RFI_30226 [Reticulomyxa filosa]|uniref:Uncharacterized protein n=1 Tax=Reticulomyxa filosa TaxID=46433 RepID=X6M0L7_RETFI|nr:hypothetical protein RFI_30226 [Reticulomyxa filosa]|eukprot:ETO07166.1 hypothetical protein RFI_30226 [Reticulomyxa filosa]